MDGLLLASLSGMWSDLLLEFGPLIGVILFFIWRDWMREATLSKRIESLEGYQRETLANLVERSTAALAQNTECLQWVTKTLSKVCEGCPPYRVEHQRCHDR